MAVFEYRAVDDTGKVVTGTLASASKDKALGELGAKGFVPVSIGQKKISAMRGPRLSSSRKTKPRDVAVFTRQLATFVRGGVPMMSCLTALSHQAENETMKETIAAIQGDVEQGVSLSAAMGKHPGMFSELYVNSVMAGETGGVLDEVLDRLAMMLETEAETRAKVKAAVSYPIMVVCALVIAFIVLLVFVLPKFKQVFAAGGVALPLPTRILLALSVAIRGYWFIVVPAAAAVVGIVVFYSRTKSGRFFFDRLKLSLPILGPVFSKASMSRFSHMFATLNKSGLPVLTTIEVLSRSMGNVIIGRELEAMGRHVQAGNSISSFLMKSELFPPLVSHMTAVGEDTGALDELLEHVSGYYDSELKVTINNLSSLIEPILIVGLGLIILVFALAVFLPMWDLMTAVRY